MLTNRLLALGLFLAALSFIADQLLKRWAHGWVGANGIGRPISGLNIIATSNTGVGFSVAQGAGPWILISIGLALSALLLAWLARTQLVVHAVGLGLAIGGAISNVLDRLRLGAVRDFIDVYWREWRWPAFNVADVAIVTGPALLILFQGRPTGNEKVADGDRDLEDESRR